MVKVTCISIGYNDTYDYRGEVQVSQILYDFGHVVNKVAKLHDWTIAVLLYNIIDETSHPLRILAEMLLLSGLKVAVKHLYTLTRPMSCFHVGRVI